MGLSEAECMLFRMSIELNMTKPPFTSTFLIIGTFLTLIQVAAIFFLIRIGILAQLNYFLQCERISLFRSFYKVQFSLPSVDSKPNFFLLELVRVCAKDVTFRSVLGDNIIDL